MIKLITIQTAWAISKAEAKAHLHITSTDEDDYIENVLIKAAQEACENFTGRKFNDGIYDYYLDEFPSGSDLAGVIYLPYSPIQEVTHIKYDDTNDEEQTLSASTGYRSDVISSPPRVVPIDNFPDTYDKINSVRIRFQT
ncbi:MAG: head-tail connector protein, partial [Candidatus Hodarchaeales archaeon]